MRYLVLGWLVFVLTFTAAPVFACKCVPPPPNIKTARELVEWSAKEVDQIFEGRVVNSEVKATWIEAQVGDLVPTDLDEDWPVILVSFDVSRVYRGVEQKHLQLTTGLGGGDCGFDFEIGKDYLVYALRDESGQLSTSICSGTAPLEESEADLAYLRGDPVWPKRASSTASTSPGTLCGRVVRNSQANSANDRLLVFRVGSSSPIPYSGTEPGADGSFCVDDLTTGKYRLLFTNGEEGAPTSFVFFPGVTKFSEAAQISVAEGRTDLVFNIPLQPTYSVSGTVSVSANSASPAESKVMLVSAEQPFFGLAYLQDVAPNGSFSFPHVLPGKYWAFVTVDSETDSEWFTKKTCVDVGANVTGLSLSLAAK